MPSLGFPSRNSAPTFPIQQFPPHMLPRQLPFPSHRMMYLPIAPSHPENYQFPMQPSAPVHHKVPPNAATSHCPSREPTASNAAISFYTPHVPTDAASSHCPPGNPQLTRQQPALVHHRVPPMQPHQTVPPRKPTVANAAISPVTPNGLHNAPTPHCSP